MSFNLFVNNLALQVKSLNCGITLGDTIIIIFIINSNLYANDVALIFELEDFLQKILNVVNT